MLIIIIEKKVPTKPFFSSVRKNKLIQKKSLHFFNFTHFYTVMSQVGVVDYFYAFFLVFQYGFEYKI